MWKNCVPRLLLKKPESTSNGKQQMDLGVLANLEKSGSPEALRRVAAAARKLNITLHADARTVAVMGDGVVCNAELLWRETSAVLVLGGDGSMLHANRILGESGIPLAGINTGSLGYMTCATAEQVEDVLHALHDGTARIENRSMLQATCWKGSEEAGTWHALNDVVAARGESGRVIALELAVDGRAVTTYVCDGVIAATPTGSTAYSLAAGGPIVLIETPATVLSILSPHTLSSRPLVLPDSSNIELTVRRAGAPLLLAVDGRETVPLDVGDRVCITRSPRMARVVQLAEHDAFAVLRKKLGWSGSAV